MASNRGVVYVGTGQVEVRGIDFPKLVDPRGKQCDHGVILKVVSTNICGSDQHMVRGRPSAHHMLITAANVGTHDLQNHAVVTLFAPRIDQLRKVDAAYLHFAGADVNYSAIACHVSLLLLKVHDLSALCLSRMHREYSVSVCVSSAERIDVPSISRLSSIPGRRM